jgi:hypothetical protein
LDFLNFQYLTTEFGWAKAKANVERAFFLLFMSSCPEMGFLNPKKRNIH